LPLPRQFFLAISNRRTRPIGMEIRCRKIAILQRRVFREPI
jgi:hypothetical protein